MVNGRTKRLTDGRALSILQLNYGSQIRRIVKEKSKYIADSICCEKREFTREDILKLEDEMYSAFGV